MLGHALRAVETGAASVILVTGGDATGLGYAKVAANFNIVTQLHLAPLGHGGPNGVYALVTSRQMKTYGLQKSDYGHLAIAQRAGARQVEHARLAVTTGYGMTLYRYGGTAAAAVLERTE
jgi:acetyl-CoA acetyltransferase